MLNLLQNQEFIINCSLSALGILLTICYPTIIKKYRQIAYTFKTTKISLKDATENCNLRLSYNGRLLSELYYTDLIIWCKGKEMIDAYNVAPASQLTISVAKDAKDIDILDSQILIQNEPANNFCLRRNGNNIIVNFDFLNHKNGTVIRIVHTGNDQNIAVSCTLKEGRKILHVGDRKGFFYNIFENKKIKSILSHKLTSFVVIVFAVFFFPIAFVQSGNYSGNNFFNLPDNNIFMNLDSIIILMLCIASLILSVPHFYNLFKSEPPKDLQNYDSLDS